MRRHALLDVRVFDRSMGDEAPPLSEEERIEQQQVYLNRPLPDT